ncbi:AAA family ATPase [Leifsonia sp. NPDC056665]|uniref:AAA family ATPase n=1 Tax=Leifsonia sp. NPDC056665 TaxID=3345901 RepID=UPI0036CF3152
MHAVFLNGTVGVGKTTVADAMSDLEARPHAVVDLDEIRRFRPAAAGDPFNLGLQLANVAALVANFGAAGAQLVVVAGVIESREDAERFRRAVGGAATFVRLTADATVIERRLRARHGDDPDGLAWHLARARELTAILDSAGIEGEVVDTSADDVEVVAARVLRTVAVAEGAQP